LDKEPYRGSGIKGRLRGLTAQLKGEIKEDSSYKETHNYVDQLYPYKSFFRKSEQRKRAVSILNY